MIALLGTIVAAGLWVMKGSAQIDDLDSFLGVTAGVGIFFSAGMFLVRRLTSGVNTSQRLPSGTRCRHAVPSLAHGGRQTPGPQSNTDFRDRVSAGRSSSRTRHRFTN